MTAKQWFGRFYKLYYANKNVKHIVNSGEYEIDSKWTPAMMNLLRKVGKSFACDVSEETPVAGRGRSDQRWIKDNASQVYIEHENRCDEKIHGEIQKLCNDISKLKVLITYVADKHFGENVKRLKETIENAIHDCRGTFTGEFLLVVSGNEQHDWEAHISVLKMEPLQNKR